MNTYEKILIKILQENHNVRDGKDIKIITYFFTNDGVSITYELHTCNSYLNEESWTGYSKEIYNSEINAYLFVNLYGKN